MSVNINYAKEFLAQLANSENRDGVLNDALLSIFSRILSRQLDAQSDGGVPTEGAFPVLASVFSYIATSKDTRESSPTANSTIDAVSGARDALALNGWKPGLETAASETVSLHYSADAESFYLTSETGFFDFLPQGQLLLGQDSLLQKEGNLALSAHLPDVTAFQTAGYQLGRAGDLTINVPAETDFSVTQRLNLDIDGDVNFTFEGEEKEGEEESVLTLGLGSRIDMNQGTLNISGGTLNFTRLSDDALSGVGELELSSGVMLSVAQLRDHISSIRSTENSTLNLVARTLEEVQEAQDLIRERLDMNLRIELSPADDADQTVRDQVLERIRQVVEELRDEGRQVAEKERLGVIVNDPNDQESQDEEAEQPDEGTGEGTDDGTTPPAPTPTPPAPTPDPVLTVSEALAAQAAGELPEVYELSSGELTLAAALSVADTQEALSDAQALINGAANEEPVALNATYALLDDADVLLAKQNAELVAAATSVSVTNEALNRTQFEALKALENFDQGDTPVDDAPVVAIAEGTENALLTGTVLGVGDTITDADGFGGSATVTLAYDDAVTAQDQYGTPEVSGSRLRALNPDEFRVARDGESFTLIANAARLEASETDTAIGTVTPVGLALVEGSDPAESTVTGYTIELNDKVTPQLLTALLQRWNVQQAADGSNTQLTVTLESAGGAEPVVFVRYIKGDDAGAITLMGNEAALEAELTAGALKTQTADAPFAPFGNVSFEGEPGTIPGMKIELFSSNSADKVSLSENSLFDIINGQLIVTLGDGTLEVVATVTGIDTHHVTITARQELPLDFDEGAVTLLLQKLLIDLEGAEGDRRIDVNITSGDGLSDASLSRDISVLGEFTEVTLSDIGYAGTGSYPVVTIDGNTILDVTDWDGALDIQAQIDAGNLIVEGSNPIRIVVSSNETGATDLSDVTGLERLGELHIMRVGGGITVAGDCSPHCRARLPTS